MKKNNVKVSIIIPVYNAERYLDKCIESVCNQTEEEIEIILINDESTDMSGSICENWAKKDDRIRVFHIKNEGVSNARNYGINMSSGDVIMFVDSDDWIKNNMVEIMLGQLSKSKAQSVFCDYINVSNSEEKRCERVIDYRKYENDEINKVIRNMFGGGKYYSSIWRGIYIKNIIKENNIFFKDMGFAEDLLFNLEYLFNCNSSCIIEDALYYYRENETSALQSLKSNIKEIKKVPIMIHQTLKKYNAIDEFSREFENEVSLTIKRIFDINNNFFEFKNTLQDLDQEIMDDIEKTDRVVRLFCNKEWKKLYLTLWIIKLNNFRKQRRSI